MPETWRFAGKWWLLSASSVDNTDYRILPCAWAGLNGELMNAVRVHRGGLFWDEGVYVRLLDIAP